MTLQYNGYAEFLEELRQRIRAAQIRAALAVNREMILLYWQIGKDILAKQAELGWGAKVVDQLSKDLRREFPEIKGFSRTNLLYMRLFAQAYPEEQIVQQLVGQLPWGHNIRIIEKIKDPGLREWYLRKTIHALSVPGKQPSFSAGGFRPTHFFITTGSPR